MRTKIIYHQIGPGYDCPDGICAAWSAQKALPYAEVIGCSYQSVLPIVNPGDTLYLVDFSFKKGILQKWADSGVKIIMLDHHESTFKDIAGIEDPQRDAFIDLSSLAMGSLTGLLKNDECGATLTWKYFFPDRPMPTFLEYVRDRDLWDFLLPETNAIHEAMATLKRTFALLDKLEPMNREELLNFLMPIGEPLVEPKQKKVAEVADRFQWMEFTCPDGSAFTIPVVKLAKDGSEDRLTSDICMKLYRQFPEAKFSACITSDGSWSLRSDKLGNNFNVRAIAEQFGGGGHRNSSGFKQS